MGFDQRRRVVDDTIADHRRYAAVGDQALDAQAFVFGQEIGRDLGNSQMSGNHIRNGFRVDLSQSLRFRRGWVSFREILRRRSDDDRFQGQPLRAGYHPLGRPMVCGVSDQLSTAGRDDV
jgi:hypothetical protein